MTHDRDIERTLDRWFADGPEQAPDRVIDVVADRIGRQRQRPAWRPDRRLHPVNTPTKVAVALAAVVVLAVGGLMLLRPSSSNVAGPGPTPSVSPTVSPSPSPSVLATPFACEDPFHTCAGPLTSGAHHASHFDPKVYFVTSNGWLNSIDATTIYKLDRVDGGPSLLVWSRASIAEQKASCDPVPKPGAGSTASDWKAFISSHPGLASTNVAVVYLDGSKGWSMDITVQDAWKSTCPAHGDKPYVMILANAVGGEYGLSAGDALHVVVVDVIVPGCPTCEKKTVVMQVYGSPEAVATAKALIATFSFGCGVAFNRGPCSPGF